jgi:hypothetical protein
MTLKARRFLGLELGGSRSHRTAMVALDFFPGRAFVAELHAQLHGEAGEEGPDQELVRLINASSHEVLAVNAPLSLPPCVSCELPACPSFERCEQPAISWMRAEAAKLPGKTRVPSPYTQRPVDLLLRGKWQQDLPVEIPVDESFGSARAPLAARMMYLRRHFNSPKFLEVNPRLALAGIAPWYKITERELRRCRDVEDGIENRASILEKLCADPKVEAPKLFLYNSDLTAFIKDLPAFDALLAALMGLYEDQALLESLDWDSSWGRIAKPRRLSLATRLPAWEAEK